MPTIRSIIAIGQRGQLGLKGRLPWEGDPRRPFVEDVERFFEITRGHVILCGPRTYASVPDFARADRDWVELRSSTPPHEALAPFAARVVYVGGGPAVWDVYAPLIQHWDITRLPYDGPADRWFNPAWLVATGAALEPSP
ncbi:MAG: dihydrofolate reductase [Hyphomicrobiales bacterium]|nr:dihydrofolate reductase [Hyphomicrobiales bacterium]